MQLVHTSPAPITAINDTGVFGSFLCFSDYEYVMAAGEHITYTMELNEGDIIEAESILFQEGAEQLQDLTEKVMALVGCDEETADDLISQTQDVWSVDTEVEPEDLGEVSWELQRISAEAAKRLGYRGVSMSDEQGRVYLIDMLGRESELKESAGE